MLAHQVLLFSGNSGTFLLTRLDLASQQNSATILVEENPGMVDEKTQQIIDVWMRSLPRGRPNHRPVHADAKSADKTWGRVDRPSVAKRKRPSREFENSAAQPADRPRPRAGRLSTSGCGI